MFYTKSALVKITLWLSSPVLCHNPELQPVLLVQPGTGPQHWADIASHVLTWDDPGESMVHTKSHFLPCLLNSQTSPFMSLPQPLWLWYMIQWQKLAKERKVYRGSQFQRYRFYHGEKGKAIGKKDTAMSRRLADHIASTLRKQRERKAGAIRLLSLSESSV